jgi:hypothetical protein
MDMTKFLNILRFSALLSGILAELLPTILKEYKKRDEKVLVVTKTENRLGLEQDRL